MKKVRVVRLRKALSLRMMLVALPVMILVGCSSHATKPTTDSYSQLMQQAATSKAAGNVDDAEKYFHKAAAVDPTRGEPWYQLARIQFSMRNYGRAIVTAREAIKRDPTNTEAQSILTVSGLRVAVQALGNLHDETDPDGPAHQEAQQLVKEMRNVLGQQVLVPPTANASVEPKHHRRARRVVRRHRQVRKAPTPVQTPAAKQPATPTKTYSNPFQALPGSGN